MHTLFQDVRYAFRMLRKAPGFTSIAVLTLALGIGANTAIFSLINAVLLKALPVKEQGQLVIVGDPARAHSRNLGTPQPDLFSYPLYRKLRDVNTVFTGMAASGEVHRMKVETDAAGEITDKAVAVLVSGNYFSVLGVNAFRGRVLNPDDDTTVNGHPVAVISYSFWKEKFGGEGSVVGQTVRLSGNPYSIVGVAAPGFFGDTVGDSQDFWIPMAMQPQLMPGRNWLEKYDASWLRLMARLKPDVGKAKAAADMNLIFQQVWAAPDHPKFDPGDLDYLRKSKVEVVRGGLGFSTLRRDFYHPLQLMMAIVGLVLLIASVNVANLLLGRASARRKEIAVRLSLGASPLRLVRQLLTESILLAFAGGTCGLLVASWGTRALLSLALTPGEDALDASLDWHVLVFTAGVCVLTGILFGLVPAWRSLRFELTSALKASASAGASGRSTGRHWNWGKLLVSSQVALSLLVLFAAGLLVRSLRNLQNLDLGYSREHLLVMNIDPVAAGYNAKQFPHIIQEISRRLATVPGVRNATVSENGLFSGIEGITVVKVEGYNSTRDADRQSAFDQVGPNYFSTLGIPVLLGREIGPQDTPTSPPVVMINESMARMYFGKSNPIGRKIWLDDDDAATSKPLEIVGVARDTHDHDVRKTVDRRFYIPIVQNPESIFSVHFEVRAVGDPMAIADSIRKEIRDFDAHIPVGGFKTADELVSINLGHDALIARLSSFFGLLALLLASIGLYGVMSYSVSDRTREIGVRMALGADRPAVLWMVLREAMKPILWGIVIGIPAALAASRLIAAMLFGLPPSDPLSMAAVIVLLTAVALFAGFVPARRATKVDPMIALRYE